MTSQASAAVRYHKLFTSVLHSGPATLVLSSNGNRSTRLGHIPVTSWLIVRKTFVTSWLPVFH